MIQSSTVIDLSMGSLAISLILQGNSLRLALINQQRFKIICVDHLIVKDHYRWPINPRLICRVEKANLSSKKDSQHHQEVIIWVTVLNHRVKWWLQGNQFKELRHQSLHSRWIKPQMQSNLHPQTSTRPQVYQNMLVRRTNQVQKLLYQMVLSFSLLIVIQDRRAVRTTVCQLAQMTFTHSRASQRRQKTSWRTIDSL